MHRNIVVGLVSLMYGIVLVWSLVTLITPPRLSVALTELPGSMHIAAVAPGSMLWDRGVRPGAVVLALDGQRPAAVVGAAWTGERVEVRAATGETILVDAATIGHQRAKTWSLVLLSPWFLLLGTLVYLRAPHPPVGRATFALFVSAAFALALAPLSISEYIAAVVAEWIAVPLFGACFTHFCFTFPTSRGGPGPRRWILLLLPLCGAIVVSLLTLRYPSLYEHAALVRMSILLGYLLIGLVVLSHAFISTPDHPARRGFAIISGGTLASMLPFVGLYLLPTVLHHPPVLAAEYAILPLALLPATFAYAILRHQVLNISLVQRWLVRLLVWSALLAVYAGSVYAAQRVMRTLPEPAHSFLLTGLLVVFVGVSFTWLRTQVQQVIDRVVFKDSYTYRDALRALSHDLSRATNLDTLSISLPSTLRRLMNLDFALLLVHEAPSARTIGSAGTYQPALLPDLATAARDVQTVPQVVPLGYGYLNVLLVPLRTHDAVVAHLCLGPKVNGEPFRAEDKDLLATLSGHVAGIVQNAQLVAALQIQVHELDVLNDRLQHAQEAERTRLSADIHDEPLQTAMSLQRQLASVPGDGRALAPLIALNQLLITQLRSVCIQMRPAALDDLGLFAALDQLIQEQSERAKLPIRLEVDPALIDYELSSSHTTVLYRAAQEALTNSLRHARPRSIDVCVHQHGHAVQLRVTDDGAGFIVPPHFKQLVAEGHLGLTGLRERAHHSGGSLHVTSTPGQGTTVEVELPLQPAGAA